MRQYRIVIEILADAPDKTAAEQLEESLHSAVGSGLEQYDALNGSAVCMSELEEL